MGSLERVLTNQASSPQLQAQPSQGATYQTATPASQPTQAQPWAYQAPQAQPTYSTNAYSTPTSSQTSTVQPTQETQGSQLSEASAAVVNHFGIEAPGILNQYACTLEDMLMQEAGKMDQMIQRGAALENILTDPDNLADYTDRFFTDVYPVDIDGEGEYVQEEVAPQQYQQQYDMPAIPAGQAGSAPNTAAPAQQWEGFSQVMNRNPENAWRYLQGMKPEAVRSKLLFMEGA